MNNNFINICFTNNKYLYIKFNRQMLLSGEHEISNANNYAIRGVEITNTSPCTNLSLENFISEVYYYGNDFIIFKLKENAPSLLNTTLFGGYIFLSSIFFITDVNEYIHDFSCPSIINLYLDNPSIENCSVKITSNKTLTLQDLNNVPIIKYCIADFYIRNGNATFSPISIKANLDGTFTFTFKTEIIKYNNETLYFCTKSKCLSSDALANTLLSNQCISTLNQLLTSPVSLSIFSYINDVLGVALEFNDIITRYDSNDFHFCIDNKQYYAKGRLSHNKDNIIYFFIYDVLNFDYSCSKVTITYKNAPISYTLDKNLCPLNMNAKISSNILYGIGAKLDNISDAQIGFLNITFNNYLLPTNYSVTGCLDTFKNLKHQIFSNLIFNYVPYFNSIDDSLNVFYINDFAIILFHTVNTQILSSSIHSVEINSFDKNFICEIQLSNYNFLNLLKDKIEYIEIIPLIGIKSYNYTSPISTLEIPTEFLISGDIELVFQPNEQNQFQELLGTTISVPTTLLVDKTFNTYTYGDINVKNKIIFTNTLYIKSIDSSEIFKNPILDIINIEGSTLYISLDDNYDINFDSCHFDDVILL